MMRANDKIDTDRINEIVHRMNDFHGLVLSKLALFGIMFTDRVGTESVTAPTANI